MTLIKSDIVSLIANQINVDRKVASDFVELILSEMKSGLSKGQEITISGFGRFETRLKKPRVGRNPKTGQEFEICERTVVTFYPSKVFRKELNHT